MRIPTNRNPFSQGEVNFAKIMFYNELEPDDESPTPSTPGAPILEEEEEERGRGARDLRNLLERKRQKRELSSSRSRDVVVREPRGRVIYRL